MKKNLYYLIMVVISGCSVALPVKWSTEKEAFPDGTTVESSSPGDIASRQSIMNYPYADVFTSAEKAMSFAQINLTESNQVSGIIYGTRSSLVGGLTKKFYYMIKLKEEGPEKCNVSVYSKQQQRSTYFKWVPFVILPSVGLAAMSFALLEPGGAILPSVIYPAIIAPITWFLNKNAEKTAALKWSPDDDEYLDRIMSFIRTDLLQK